MRSGFRTPFKRNGILSTSGHHAAQRVPAPPAGTAQREADVPIRRDEAAAERVARWAEEVRMLVRSGSEVVLPRGSTLAAVLATTAYLVITLLVLWLAVATTFGR